MHDMALHTFIVLLLYNIDWCISDYEKADDKKVGELKLFQNCVWIRVLNNNNNYVSVLLYVYFPDMLD